MKGENLETERCNVATKSVCACKTTRDPTVFGFLNVCGSTHKYAVCTCLPVHVYAHHIVNISKEKNDRTHVGLHGNEGQRRARSPNPNQESSASSPGLGMPAP